MCFAESIKVLIKAPFEVFVETINSVGVQRLSALLTLAGYIYMSISGLEVSATYFTLMTALNSAHLGKSIANQGAKAAQTKSESN